MQKPLPNQCLGLLFEIKDPIDPPLSRGDSSKFLSKKQMLNQDSSKALRFFEKPSRELDQECTEKKQTNIYSNRSF